MAISLGFHIIFAAVGIAMSFFMAISHWKWLKTKEVVYFDLTKAWSKGSPSSFVTGAVSGTVLSIHGRRCSIALHGNRGCCLGPNS
jgi:cytochrome bd ubiquinol oxidase subunit I